MANSRIDILINAKNKASPQLKAVGKDIGGLNNAVAGAVAGLSAMGLAFSALKLGGLAVELTKGAEGAKRVEEAYRNLAKSAGTSADEVLASMTKMSAGTISETDLMLSANRAMMLGVASSAEEMAGLIEVALERGSALGLPAQQAFNDIVTGIGRLSPKILDNLGIIVDADAAYAAYAESVGMAADSLSEAEQKQAILNSILLEANGALDISVDKFAALSASADNARDAIGEMIGPTVIAGLTQLTEAADSFIAALDRIQSGETSTFEEFKNRMVGDIANQLQGYKALADEIEKINGLLSDAEERFISASNAGDWKAVSEAAKEIESFKNQIVVSGQAMNMLSEASNGVLAAVSTEAGAATAALNTVTASVVNQTVAWQRLGGAISLSYNIGEIFDPALERADATIQRMGSNLYDVLGPSGIQGFIEDGSGAVRAQKEEWQALGYEPKFINDVLMPGFLGGLDDGIRKTATLGSATATVSEEYSKLESTVANVLSGAIGPVAGVNADDFFPREDAINENARRLADIMVNGLTGQDWIGEFAAGAPDVYAALISAGDPQAAAASMLRDFQDGLRPDLIDKEAAKERIKRMILGDENTAALAQEIAGELAAELGISLQQAQQAASSILGTGGGEDSAVISDTLKKSEKRIGTTGEDAGKVWGIGFLSAIGENVPPALVAILVQLTTPGVYAQISAANSRAEAE